MHRISKVTIWMITLMVAMLLAGCSTGAKDSSVGDTQNIEVSGQELEVTPRNVIDPLAGVGVRPPAGSRIIGVEIEFKNTGSKPVSFQPGGLVQLMASWRPMSPTDVGGGSCATDFTFAELEVGPGSTESGCLVYDAPKNVHVTTLRMHSDSNSKKISWKLK